MSIVQIEDKKKQEEVKEVFLAEIRSLNKKLEEQRSNEVHISSLFFSFTFPQLFS